MPKRTRWLISAAVVLLAVLGCDQKDKIQIYRLVKAPPESASPDLDPATTTNPSAQSVGTDQTTTSITTTAPADWEAQSAGNLRQASFLVKGKDGALADVSLVILDGSAGGLLDNVNRWLSQLGQSPISADQLTQKAQKLTSRALGEITVVDLEGLPAGADSSKDGRILAAIATNAGKTIFFKIRGNSDLVGAQKDAFWSTQVCSNIFPAHHPATEKVQNHRQVQPAFNRGDLGNVTCPFFQGKYNTAPANSPHYVGPAIEHWAPLKLHQFAWPCSLTAAFH